MKVKKLLGWILIVLGLITIGFGLYGCRMVCFGAGPCPTYDVACLILSIIIGLILVIIGIFLIKKKRP